MVGLCLTCFGFRKKLPLTPRSALYPALGEKIYGTIGHAVDLLAVFGTVFGVATSLGLGVNQIAAGLNVLFGVDAGITTQIILIALISVAATFSAVSGVPDYCGMEYLSQHRPCRVLSLCRPDRMADGLLRYDHRRLPLECGGDGLLGRR